MIEYRSEGDLVYDPSDILICPVNCIPGVMGKGLALAFKRRWPELVKAHREALRLHVMGIGLPHMVPVSDQETDVCLFPTKNDWRQPSRLDWVAQGLRTMVKTIHFYNQGKTNIRSVATPGLGCGLGGLPWHQVRPLIELAELQTPDVRWTVYEPSARNRS